MHIRVRIDPRLPLVAYVIKETTLGSMVAFALKALRFNV